ncbi:hypothetical protein KCU88_g99, partial [Aureobasidium melanogenum]
MLYLFPGHSHLILTFRSVAVEDIGVLEREQFPRRKWVSAMSSGTEVEILDAVAMLAIAADNAAALNAMRLFALARSAAKFFSMPNSGARNASSRSRLYVLASIAPDRIDEGVLCQWLHYRKPLIFGAVSRRVVELQLLSVRAVIPLALSPADLSIDPEALMLLPVAAMPHAEKDRLVICKVKTLGKFRQTLVVNINGLGKEPHRLCSIASPPFSRSFLEFNSGYWMSSALSRIFNMHCYPKLSTRYIGVWRHLTCSFFFFPFACLRNAFGRPADMMGTDSLTVSWSCGTKVSTGKWKVAEGPSALLAEMVSSQRSPQGGHLIPRIRPQLMASDGTPSTPLSRREVYTVETEGALRHLL